MKGQEAVNNSMSSIKVYNILKGKSFTDEEAQYIANAIEQKNDVATKTDLLNQKIELKQDINDLKVDLIREFTKFKVQTLVMCIVIIALIVFTNPKVFDLVAKLAGIPK